MMISQHAVGFAIGVVVVGSVALQVSDRAPPVNVEIEIKTPVVKPGDDLVISYHRTAAGPDGWACDATAYRAIYDGEDRETRYMPEERLSGGPAEDNKTIHLAIPLDAAPGPARYRLTAVYRCTAFQRVWPVDVVYPDQRFIIAAKE